MPDATWQSFFSNLPANGSCRTDKPHLTQVRCTNPVDGIFGLSTLGVVQCKYNMTDTKDSNATIQIASIIKPCPFCSGHACITTAAEPGMFSVRCGGCSVALMETYENPESAVAAWRQRRGTASAAGGRSTRGKCSWRKRRSCKRNLRLARRRKKLKQITANLLITLPWVQALRKFERAETEAEKARAWASLKEMEPAVMSTPSLRPYYKFLNHYAP